MYPIVNKQILAKDVKRLDILAPDIAQSFQPGQFVIVIPFIRGEWLPLSVVETDKGRGLITVIVQEVGVASRQLGQLPINDQVWAVTGPHGRALEAQKAGTVVCVATGVGTAQILPICRAFKGAGNKVLGVIGAKTKSGVMLEPQMRLACNHHFIATEDGSYLRHGTASSIVKELLDREEVNLVYAIGNMDMMEEVSAMTKEKSIAMRVQVSPLVLCGSGICGSCRVKVGGDLCLACQDGVEFDAHLVDFEDLKRRQEAAVPSGADREETQVNDPATQSMKKFFVDFLNNP